LRIEDCGLRIHRRLSIVAIADSSSIGSKTSPHPHISSRQCIRPAITNDSVRQSTINPQSAILDPQ